MAYRGQSLMLCPDCGKRGVLFRTNPREGDIYECRYCHEFYAWADGGYSEDELNRDRLRAANPEMAEVL